MPCSKHKNQKKGDCKTCRVCICCFPGVGCKAPEVHRNKKSRDRRKKKGARKVPNDGKEVGAPKNVARPPLQQIVTPSKDQPTTRKPRGAGITSYERFAAQLRKEEENEFVDEGGMTPSQSSCKRFKVCHPTNEPTKFLLTDASDIFNAKERVKSQVAALHQQVGKKRRAVEELSRELEIKESKLKKDLTVQTFIDLLNSKTKRFNAKEKLRLVAAVLEIESGSTGTSERHSEVCLRR